jgi:hypothetical protein
MCDSPGTAQADPQPPGAPLNLQDYLGLYDAYRKYLVHEDDLINQRTSWTVAIQSFSIAAVGWVFTAMINPSNGADPYVVQECKRLIQFFCALGIGVSLISAGGILAAESAISRLEGEWSKQAADSPYHRYLPPLTGAGNRSARLMGHALPLSLPLFLMTLWALLLIYIYVSPLQNGMS